MNGCIAREVCTVLELKVQVQDEWKRKYHRALLERCGENSTKERKQEKVPRVVDFNHRLIIAFSIHHAILISQQNANS
eukprot:scaffold10323_cov168-Skeletonema_marinoi.AAC.1